MELLLQDVSEGRDAVVQGRRIHREHGVHQDRKQFTLGPDFERSLGMLEGLGGAKYGGADLPGMEFARLDRQRVAVHEVPGVAAQFPLDVGDQPRRAIKAERLTPSQRDAQQPVEPDEVVHVRVRDERVHGAQQPRRAQCRVVAQIEQKRAPGPADLDVQTGVAERRGDEISGGRGGHEAVFLAMAMLRRRPSWVVRRTALWRNADWNSAADCRAKASRSGFKVSGVARNAGSAVGVAWWL